MFGYTINGRSDEKYDIRLFLKTFSSSQPGIHYRLNSSKKFENGHVSIYRSDGFYYEEL